MKAIGQLGLGLIQEERNLLSVAYKNVIGTRRASWRIVSSLESRDKKDGEESKNITTEYRKKIEKELQDICNDILDLLDCHLIPSTTADSDGTENVEACVFYHKM